MEEIKDRAARFVSSVREEIQDDEKLSFQRILNADQSGINLEMTYGRTLAVCGDTNIFGQVQRTNACTHSFTIMPIISSAGKLYDPLYVVLKEEQDMKFGPRVMNTIFKHPKLVTQASKSGKMTNRHTKEFFEEIVFHVVEPDSVFLVDTWSGHSRTETFEQPEHLNLQLRFIPPSTTGLIQPQDVYFFRPWKTFYRRVSNILKIYSGLGDGDIIVSQRNVVLKLVLYVHSQFQAPRFE